MGRTKVTNTVIEANTIVAESIQNDAIRTRHIADANVTLAKLASDADFRSNDFTTYQSALANDFVTYQRLNSNLDIVSDNAASKLSKSGGTMTGNIVLGTDIFVNTAGEPPEANSLANKGYVDSELASNDFITFDQLTKDFQANDFVTWDTLNSRTSNVVTGVEDFTGSTITFKNDVLVQGDLTVSGNNFVADVGTITSEDANIVLNKGGSDALAEGGGLNIEGTGGALIANLLYAAASVSNFRAGVGTLTSADDITRTQDFQANDFTTFNQLTLDFQANDFTTFNQLTLDFQANDFTTYQSALANDFLTFDQLTKDFQANDFVTFQGLNSNINVVSSNTDGRLSTTGGTMTGNIVLGVDIFVTSAGEPPADNVLASKGYVDSVIGINLLPFNTSNTSDGNSNVFSVVGDTPISSNNHTVYLDGVFQIRNIWIFNSGNNSVQFTDSGAIPSGVQVSIDTWV